ncbi:hypothetical protein ACLGL1_00920 [Peptococcus simiae]|uniref:hypothetical protein n=1 Tax=Peptococcus simiae TaxID=1643805 RepID=UPI00397F336C
MGRPCRFPLSGRQRAGALILVLFVFAVVMVILMTGLALIRFQVASGEAAREDLAVTSLLDGAIRATRQALPADLPAPGASLTLFDTDLSANHHIAAYLKREDAYRVTVQAQARQGTLPVRTQTRKYYAVRSPHALDGKDIMVYDLNGKTDGFRVWLSRYGLGPLVLTPPEKGPKDDLNQLGQFSEPAGLHMTGDLMVQASLRVNGDLIVNGDLQLAAPVEAKNIYLDGRVTITGAGRLKADRLQVREEEGARLENDEALGTVIEARIVSHDQAPTYHYYDLGLAPKEVKWTINNGGQGSSKK